MKHESKNVKDKLELPACTLLFLLLFYLFFISAFPIQWHSELYSIVANCIYINLIFLINTQRKEILLIVIVLIILELLLYQMQLSILGKLSFIFNVALFLFVITKFLIQIAKGKEIGLTSILQSINGYLLLGILSGVVIGFLMAIAPGSFTFPESVTADTGVSHMSDYLYLGLVTLTTLGFGDITPVLPFARSATALIAVVGQLYVAVVIALLIGKFASRK